MLAEGKKMTQTHHSEKDDERPGGNRKQCIRNDTDKFDLTSQPNVQTCILIT